MKTPVITLAMCQPRVSDATGEQNVRRYWLMNDYEFNTHDVVNVYSDKEKEDYSAFEYAEERTSYLIIDVVLPEVMWGNPAEIERDIIGSIFNELLDRKLIRYCGADFVIKRDELAKLH